MCFVWDIGPSLKLEAKLKAQRVQDRIKSLLDRDEKIVFQQSASYRGGILGHVYNGEENFDNGSAFVLSRSFAFYNESISWKVFYKDIIEAKLDCFQMGSSLGFRAAIYDVGRQLQQTRNILQITYVDQKGIERDVRFQIHGDFRLAGEEVKAREF